MKHRFKYVFTLLILAFFLLVSCKKGKADFVLKGIITDSTFGNGFSGLTLELYQVPAGSGVQNLIGTTSTASDGSYSFTFSRDQAESYVLKASPNNYFPIDETIYFSELTIDNDNVRNYSTTAKSWVKLRFVNQNPASASDKLFVIKTVGKSGCVGCFPDQEQQYNGIVDTTIVCLNDGNSEFKYYYETIGTPLSGFKSCISAAFDTTGITLNY